MAKALSVAIIGTRGYPSYYGGFETAVRQIVPHLLDHGWEVTVYGRSSSIETNRADRDARARSVTTPGINSRSLSTLTFGFTATAAAMITRPDVALVMNVANGYWLPMLKARAIPTLVNVDGIEWERAKWGTVGRKIFYFGAHMVSRHANCLIYDSREIARRWKSDFDTEGVYIPYGGTSPDVLPVEHGLRHRGYALMVARLVPENTISEFLEAVPTIARQYPVAIVGTSSYGSPLDAQVKELSERLPNVTWLGHINDDQRLDSLWQHAGAYFHGHSVGGTNPALVQAMACGAPIVARDTPYNREVLQSAGRFVAPAARQIATGLLAVLDDAELANSLSTAAQNRAATTYTWTSVCSSYERALTDLAHRDRTTKSH